MICLHPTSLFECISTGSVSEDQDQAYTADMMFPANMKLMLHVGSESTQDIGIARPC
jgi:hypothetical protein